MREENKLFSATQTFFQAPQSTSRRASSVDPVLFSTPGEDGPIDRRHASSPSLIHSFGSSHFFHLFDPPRGRRSRFSVDGAILPRAHPQEVRSRSPPARDSQSPPSREDTSVHPPTGAYMWASEEHKDTGDGWQEFKKGTTLNFTLRYLPLSSCAAGLYTFPISFTIPSYMPPTLSCDYGSVTWRLKANVHRPGAFTPKLSASRDVLFVASPSEDLREDAEGFAVERVWGDQMQYSISVSGRMFPIGGSIPITLSFLPMAKVKIFKISAQLEGDPHLAVADITPIADCQQSRLFFTHSSQRCAAQMPRGTSAYSPSNPGTNFRRFCHTLRRQILPYKTCLQRSPQA
jgi:hypothetical protein